MNFEECFQRFLPTSRVLEVGCGWGDAAAKMARLVPAGQVVAVDICYQGVIEAKLRYPNESHPNLRFLQANARRMKLDEDPFDFVVSRNCLHLLPHPGHAFRAIARNLKVGGNMHVWCMGEGNANEINRVLLQLITRPQWKDYFLRHNPAPTFASPQSCEPWLTTARLKRNYSLLIEQETRFPYLGSFLHWLAAGWSEYFEPVPWNKRAQFAKEFLAEYCASPTGPFLSKGVSLVVDATKF